MARRRPSVDHCKAGFLRGWLLQGMNDFTDSSRCERYVIFEEKDDFRVAGVHDDK